MGAMNSQQDIADADLVRQLQSKLEVFEEETVYKTKELTAGIAHLQRENLGM